MKYNTQITVDEIAANDTLKSQILCTTVIDDFEADLYQWSVDSSWTISYQSPHSGEKCLRSTNQTMYDVDQDNAIEFLLSFNLSEITNAYLSYWNKYYMEDGHDFGYVEVSTDGGQNWEQLGDAYTGTQAQWVNHIRLLDNYCAAGVDELLLRFHFVTDSSPGYPALGWYLDDVTIHQGNLPTDINSNEKTIISHFKLFDNYPNPFNAHTTIFYHLPTVGNVKIVLYDILGQQVTTLVDGHHSAGTFKTTWNGKDRFENVVSSGIYVFKMEADGFVGSKKMLFLK